MPDNKTDKVRAALESLSDSEFDWSADCGGQLPYDEWVLHKAQEALRELDGMVLVPVEPTEEQIKECVNAEFGIDAKHLSYRELYAAMIAAYVKGGE